MFDSAVTCNNGSIDIYTQSIQEQCNCEGLWQPGWGHLYTYSRQICTTKFTTYVYIAQYICSDSEAVYMAYCIFFKVSAFQVVPVDEVV